MAATVGTVPAPGQKHGPKLDLYEVHVLRLEITPPDKNSECKCDFLLKTQSSTIL